MPGRCCAPNRPETSQAARRVEAVRVDPVRGGSCRPVSLVAIPAGRYRMGDQSEWAYPGDGEGPVHAVELRSFLIDKYAVTNGQFGAFVEESAWTTDAERFEWSL